MEPAVMDETQHIPLGSLGGNLLLSPSAFNFRNRFGYDHVFYFWDMPDVFLSDLEEGYWFVNKTPYRYALKVSQDNVHSYRSLFYRSGIECFYSVTITRRWLRRFLSWRFLNFYAKARLEVFFMMLFFSTGCFLVIYPFLEEFPF